MNTEKTDAVAKEIVAGSMTKAVELARELLTDYISDQVYEDRGERWDRPADAYDNIMNNWCDDDVFYALDEFMGGGSSEVEAKLVAFKAALSEEADNIISDVESNVADGRAFSRNPAGYYGHGNDDF